MIKQTFSVFLIASSALGVVGCGSDNELTIYQKLAAIHEDTKNPSYQSVNQFRAAIDSMDQYCPETAEQLANSVVIAHNTLKESGSNMTLLEFTDGMEDVVRETQPGSPCIEIAAALTTSIQLESQ